MPSKAFKKLTLAAAAAALLLPLVAPHASPLGWLTGERVQGSGNVVKENRQASAFHGVALSVPADVEVRTGAGESVTVEGDDNVLPLIETVVENGVLKIRPVKRNQSVDTRRLKVVVQAREVDSLSVAGSGNLTATPLRAERLTLEVAGSGSIDAGRIEARYVSLAGAGSGRITAAGSADAVKASIAGSGKADASQLQAKKVEASISGSGQVLVAATQTLAAAVTGSGNIGYHGDPQVSRAVTGSGTVRRLGDAP